MHAQLLGSPSDSMTRPSLNPFSMSFPSKWPFLSLPWLTGSCSPQSVSKYVVTSLNLFPSFILTFLEPFFLNSWLLVSSWVFFFFVRAKQNRKQLKETEPRVEQDCSKGSHCCLITLQVLLSPHQTWFKRRRYKTI